MACKEIIAHGEFQSFWSEILTIKLLDIDDKTDREQS
jgi:hypothetical protein